MSDLRISQLPAASSLSESDLAPVTQLGANPTTRRATLAQLRATVHDQRSVHVRDFGAVGNGTTNDAPAIQAAINSLRGAGGGVVQFGPKTYRLASGVVIDGATVRLEGAGFTEGPGPGDGTWLCVDQTGFTPITFNGVYARGSVMRNIAVVQAQSTNFTAGWTPVNYDWFFRIQDCQGGVDFDNIFLCAITRGFYCYNSGRTDFRRIRGQVFTSGIEVDAALDVPRMSNIHFWPFWSADTNVMNYQQAQGDALVFKRADGPFIDQAFALGYRSMFRFSQSASGWTTKFYINSAYADFCKYGVLIDSYGVDGLIANLTTQGEAWAGSGASLSGSNGILISSDNCRVQIGNLRIDAVEDSAIRVTGINNRLDIFALRAVRYNTRNNGAGAIHLANSATGTPNTVIMGSPPVLEGSYAGLLNNTDGNGVVQMRAPAGSMTMPGLAIGQSNSGLWVPSATALAMSANGSEMLRLTQGGAVTLGGASGSHGLEVNALAASVNRLSVNGALASATPTLSTAGSDTNVGMQLQTKGTGSLVFAPGGATQMQVAALSNVVNFMQVQGAAANSAVGWLAAGADANISSVIGQPKGTGAVLAQTPDSSAVGGNTRGANALDLQTSRTAATQVASGQYSAVHGGYANTASAIGATVAGGSTNTANGSYTWVPGGLNASPRAAYGKGVFAAGRFAADGDAQQGWSVLRRQTTDATTTRVTADAGNAGSANTLNLPSNGAFFGRLRVISKMQGSTDVAVWDVVVAAVRSAVASSTVVFLGANASLAPTASNGTSAANWRLTVAADSSNGGIAVSITGAAASTINTVATFDSTETVTVS
ncbi:MAG: glycosyl hydrolase family 28-related protein [Burkholderiales bacterium]